MATTTIINLTDEIKDINFGNNPITLDIGEFTAGCIYYYGMPAGFQVTFLTSNYGGEIDGLMANSPLTAQYFYSFSVKNLATGSFQNTSTLNATQEVLQFKQCGRYLRIQSSGFNSIALTSFIIQLSKIK